MSNSKQYRILIIEPSQIVRCGLSTLLGTNKEFVIASELSDLSSYTSSMNDYYDIILINPLVVDYNQRTDIRNLLSIKNKLLFAISYSPYEEEIMHQYDGCIYIYDSKAQIFRRLRNAIDNFKETSSEESNKLSARERSILTAVAQGKNNKEIADEFNLSVYTVVTHRKNISNKLGINSISGLTVYAIINKMIDVTDF